ncbi:MAG: helix-turn-helix transcriptional regulator [Halothiobacillaceae bacterium]|nr:helix-turn-helix transcriptional regulator [Halothiobacillaceae bacterium]
MKDNDKNKPQSTQQETSSDSPSAEFIEAAPEDNFPKKLAELRESRGLRHDSLSELTKHADPQKRGIARTTLRGYELGITKPGIRELRILSQALGVSINRLVFGVDFSPADNVAGSPSVKNSTILGAHDEDFIKLSRFVVAMFNVGEQERDTVYRVAAGLAAAKLGEVEYRKLMDATQEFVETMIDASEDGKEGGKDPQEVLKSLAGPLLAKYGYKVGFGGGGSK